MQPPGIFHASQNGWPTSMIVQSTSIHDPMKGSTQPRRCTTRARQKHMAMLTLQLRCRRMSDSGAWSIWLRVAMHESLWTRWHALTWTFHVRSTLNRSEFPHLMRQSAELPTNHNQCVPGFQSPFGPNYHAQYRIQVRSCVPAILRKYAK